MNIAKHMEALFIAASVALCAASYAPQNLENSTFDASVAKLAVASDSRVDSPVDSQVQTVVIVGKRA